MSEDGFMTCAQCEYFQGDWCSLKERDVKESSSCPDHKQIEKEKETPIQAQSVDLHGFILDESKVMKQKPFSFFVVDESRCGIGLLLPKNREILDKGGQVIGIKQEWSPAIITSDHQIFPISTEVKRRLGIEFQAIPSEMSLRWSMQSIRDFLEKKDNKCSLLDCFLSIRLQYKEYVGYHNPTWYDISALWDLGTYFFQLFYAYPLFEKRGHKRCGKSRSMLVSSLMTFNATDLLVNPSESMLFREVHDKRPSKYIDEAEKLFQSVRGKMEGDSRAEVINSSYHHTGTVPRVEKIGNVFKTCYFHTYSPCMIGSINGLYGATEDRAIVQICQRIPGYDKEPDGEEKVWQEIRDSCYLALMGSWRSVRETYMDYKSKQLNARALQIWKPILTLAKLIDKQSPDEKIHDRLLDFACKQSEHKDSEISQDSFDFKLLKICHDLLKSGSDFLAYSDIRDAWIGEKIPRSRYLAKRLDQYGLFDFHNRKNCKRGYTISYTEFCEIISPYIDIASLASPSSPLGEKVIIEEVTKGDRNLKLVTENSRLMTFQGDESDESDESDANPEVKEQPSFPMEPKKEAKK